MDDKKFTEIEFDYDWHIKDIFNYDIFDNIIDSLTTKDMNKLIDEINNIYETEKISKDNDIKYRITQLIKTDRLLNDIKNELIKDRIKNDEKLSEEDIYKLQNSTQFLIHAINDNNLLFIKSKFDNNIIGNKFLNKELNFSVKEPFGLHACINQITHGLLGDWEHAVMGFILDYKYYNKYITNFNPMDTVLYGDTPICNNTIETTENTYNISIFIDYDQLLIYSCDKLKQIIEENNINNEALILNFNNLIKQYNNTVIIYEFQLINSQPKDSQKIVSQKINLILKNNDNPKIKTI